MSKVCPICNTEMVCDNIQDEVTLKVTEEYTCFHCGYTEKGVEQPVRES